MQWKDNVYSLPQEPPSKKLAGMFKALGDSDIEGVYTYMYM